MSNWTAKDREHMELVNDPEKRTTFFDETDPKYMPIIEDSSGLPYYYVEEPTKAKAKDKQRIKLEESTILEKLVRRNKKKKVIEEVSTS